MNQILSGREAIKDAITNSGGGGKFLKVKDGQFVVLRFLQEMDPDGTLYDEKRGVGRGFFEHVNPENFRQSFLCTKDKEGRCLGCEKQANNPKWRPKGRLFFNVLVRNDAGDDEVKIFTTTISKKGLAPVIVDNVEENGTLCDRDYKLKRTGSEWNDTVYTLTPRAPSPLKPEEEELEVIDLTTAVKDLTYEEQVDLIAGEDSGW